MKKIINKPWGYEIIWADTDKYIGKILCIKKGCKLSLQYHNEKDESIYILSGQINLVFGTENALQNKIMNVGDTFRVTPLLIHRFEAIEDSEVLEVSTAHMNDVVRLQDDYNRMKQ